MLMEECENGKCIDITLMPQRELFENKKSQYFCVYSIRIKN
jgi:hypothetical protein